LESSDELEDWTDVERSLLKAFKSGEELDLCDTDPARNDPSTSEPWGVERTIRAEVLAKLLLSGEVADPGFPTRLMLRGARISGKFDAGCATLAPFLFSQCKFDRPPFLNDAKGSFAGFVDCSLPGIDAARFSCRGPLWLSDSSISGSVLFEDAELEDLDAKGVQVASGAGHSFVLAGVRISRDAVFDKSNIQVTVAMPRAKISGNLSFRGARLSKRDSVALNAFHSIIGGSIFLDQNFEALGNVDLEGVKVDGKLILNGAKIQNQKGIAFDIDHAEVRLGIFAIDLQIDGCARMHHARVGCQVTLANARISNPKKAALRADHVIVEGSFLLDGVEITGSVDFHGASVECTFNLSNAKFTDPGDAGTAIDGDAIKVGGNLNARSLHVEGGFDLINATISGALILRKAKMLAPGRAALNADRARLGVLYLNDGFASEGAIVLTDAVMDTNLDISSSSFDNGEGRAIVGTRLAIQGNLLGNGVKVTGLCDFNSARIAGDVRILDARFNGVPQKRYAHGSPNDPQLGRPWRGLSFTMAEAHIEGEMDLRGSYFSECLELVSADVRRTVVLSGTELNGQVPMALSAARLRTELLKIDFRTSPQGDVDLSDALIGTLEDSATSWPTDGKIHINQLRYSSLALSMSTDERLAWLRRATENYSSQPYVQLAASYSSAGQDDEARRVQFESAQRYYLQGGVWLHVWGKLQDWTVGFGYKPTRAIFTFAFLWVLATLWFYFGVGACVHAGETITGLCPVNYANHPTWDPALYSLDLLVPVVNLGYKGAWDPTGFSKVVMYILTFAGWILTTTVVAAAGRKLRRN